MNEARGEREILGRAIEAFEATTGLRVQVLPESSAVTGSETFLDIAVGDRVERFVTEIRIIDRFQTLGAIKARAGAASFPRLLVAPHITEVTAEKCRELRLPFIDEAGNAYLEAPGLFVYVTGKRRPVQTRTVSAYRALTPAGLRIIFALLSVPDLVAASYREIAKAAGVALGTVGGVLADLEERGYLAPERPGPRRLLASGRLQEEWVTHYPVKLRPKLNARRFTAPARDWWRNSDIGRYQAYWGGEVAAEKLTGYLKPERVTIYMDGRPDELILANRLRPDASGDIEILKTFWRAAPAHPPRDVVPPLLVYADLMVTAESRNIETATLIHDHHLASVRDTN